MISGTSGATTEASIQPVVVDAVAISKHYGRVKAVDGLTLRLNRGEVYGLLGLNGAGKTTTIRMLLGMVRPTTGQIRLLGHPVATGRHDMWAQVGYLVETPTAYPEMTVRENLRVVAALRRLTDRHAVDAVIDRLGLTAYATRRAKNLSLGNAQRLGLAKALIHSPRLLILDEPANGLDPAGVAEIRQVIHDLSVRDGVTVLLSSHILTEVARLATRIGVIDDGRLVTEWDTTSLAQHLARRLVVTARDQLGARRALDLAGYQVDLDAGAMVLTDPHAVDRPDDVARVLVAAGHPPTHLAVTEQDLEGYFLNLVAGGQPR